MMMQKSNETSELSANNWVDVKDIRNGTLYTKSGYMIKYLKFQPFNLNLMSDHDREMMTENIASGFRGNNIYFMMMSYSRELDLDSYKADIAMRIHEEVSDYRKKNLLEIMQAEAIRLSSDGNNFEQVFLLKIWEKCRSKHKEQQEQELTNKLKDILNCYDEGKMKTVICDDLEITKICNLFSNASQASYEQMSVI